MSSNSRFGRKMPLPSTRQIRHELLALELQELTAAQRLADAQQASSVVAPPVKLG